MYISVCVWVWHPEGTSANKENETWWHEPIRERTAFPYNICTNWKLALSLPVSLSLSSFSPLFTRRLFSLVHFTHSFFFANDALVDRCSFSSHCSCSFLCKKEARQPPILPSLTTKQTNKYLMIMCQTHPQSEHRKIARLIGEVGTKMRIT
jgi:hypothetical protein